MKKRFNKNRIKIAIILGVILIGFFIAPIAANALAQTSAGAIKTQIDKIIGEENSGARLIAVDDPKKPEEKKADVKKPPTSIETSEGVNILLSFMKILSVVLRVIAAIIWPIVFLTGALMENDIIFGGGMGIVLRDMWVQIRNIVNLIFVILLVGIALYNITGIASEQFQLKQALPKIIMGLILVNFSYMIATVALDVIGVGTSAMFGLPRSIEETLIKEDKFTEKEQISLCKSISTPVEFTKKEQKTMGIPGGKDVTVELPKELKGTMCKPDGTPTDTLKDFLEGWSPHGASVIMAVKLMHMSDLQTAVLGADLTVSSLTINMIFSVVMFLVYGLAYILLFIVLLGRAIVIWLGIVLSPLIVLTYVFPAITQKAGGDLKNITDKIVQTAIAPMIIGFVLSVGYILMTTLSRVGMASEKVQFETFLGDTLTWGTQVSGLTNFQEIMIAVGTVGFVWAGVKAATSKAITSGITDKVMGVAAGAGKWLAKAPFYYTNLFPVKVGGEKQEVSLGTMLKTFTGIPGAMESKVETKAAELRKEWFGLGSDYGPKSSPSVFANKVNGIDPNQKDDVFAQKVAGALASGIEIFDAGVKRSAQNLLQMIGNNQTKLKNIGYTDANIQQMKTDLQNVINKDPANKEEAKQALETFNALSEKVRVMDTTKTILKPEAPATEKAPAPAVLINKSTQDKLNKLNPVKTNSELVASVKEIADEFKSANLNITDENLKNAISKNSNISEKRLNEIFVEINKTNKTS